MVVPTTTGSPPPEEPESPQPASEGRSAEEDEDERRASPRSVIENRSHLTPALIPPAAPTYDSHGLQAANLNFERRGHGEPIVLLHGIGGELCVWEPVLDALAERLDVIAVDLPGFGQSPPLPDGMTPTPRRSRRSVAGLMDELGIASAHLAGNSLGGWLALELGKTERALLGDRALPRRALGRAARPARAPRRAGRPARRSRRCARCCRC